MFDLEDPRLGASGRADPPPEPAPGPAGRGPGGVTQRRRGDGGWWAITSAVAVMALVFAVIGVWLPSRGGSSGVAAGASGAAGAANEVSVTLGEFFVKPASITVEGGRPLTLKVTNSGTMPHDLRLDGTQGTDMLAPGQSQTVDLGVIDHDTTAWCTVPGHKAAGMVLQVHVASADTSATTAGAAAPTSAAGTNAATATDATIDANATPAPDWKPFDPALKPAEGATEHLVTFHATEKVLEVAPGVTQQLWTFNDQVPGPILRGKLGDVFTVTLVNDGTMGHSIDFHASEVAWNDEMRTIQPGESLVYQFKAEHTGIFMYHCGTAPTLHHIGNGMYGALIVDPPDLPQVDHEFVMVQSELYLGGQGQPGDLTKMQDTAFDAVVFNGYYNQYKFSPIRVEPGQTVRVWVLDAGPNENSSFHIVGTVFDTVFKEGAYTLRPSAASGGGQALDLQPAQGGFVEFTLAEPGFYPMVTHKFANAGKGAMGLFQAGDVTMPTGMSH